MGNVEAKITQVRLRALRVLLALIRTISIRNACDWEAECKQKLLYDGLLYSSTILHNGTMKLKTLSTARLTLTPAPLPSSKGGL